MDLTQNYFDLFGLPQSFQVDKKRLAAHYRRLQKELHPDRFAGKTDGEQRLAVQFAAYVNNAYHVLKSPLLCAEYLLALAGTPVNSDALTVNDSAFLLVQMQWRESLSDLAATRLSPNVAHELSLLVAEVDGEKKRFLAEFEQAYQQENYQQAKAIVAKLHFVEKMQAELDRFEGDLLD